MIRIRRQISSFAKKNTFKICHYSKLDRVTCNKKEREKIKTKAMLRAFRSMRGFVKKKNPQQKVKYRHATGIGFHRKIKHYLFWKGFRIFSCYHTTGSINELSGVFVYMQNLTLSNSCRNQYLNYLKFFDVKRCKINNKQHIISSSFLSHWFHWFHSFILLIETKSMFIHKHLPVLIVVLVITYLIFKSHILFVYQIFFL